MERSTSAVDGVWRGTRHEGCIGAVVGMDDRLPLMIRTILVTARAAIRSNQKLGRRDLGVEGARRGLAMLDDLGARLPADTSPAVRDQYERAREELLETAGESGGEG